MINATQKPTVLIVDDDPDVREALQCLLRSVGLESRAMASVPEFMKSELPSGPTCLVLDVRLPGRSGLDFQRELSAANVNIPIIFETAHGDVPMSVQAMKGGAIEFLDQAISGSGSARCDSSWAGARSSPARKGTRPV